MHMVYTCSPEGCSSTWFGAEISTRQMLGSMKGLGEIFSKGCVRVWFWVGFSLKQPGEVAIPGLKVN